MSALGPFLEPSWRRKIGKLWRDWQAARWILKWTGLFVLGYATHATLCALHVIKAEEKKP